VPEFPEWILGAVLSDNRIFLDVLLNAFIGQYRNHIPACIPIKWASVNQVAKTYTTGTSQTVAAALSWA
jgi:hypothetical protein